MADDHPYSRVTSKTPPLCRTRSPLPPVRRKKRSAIARPKKKAGAKPRGHQHDVVRERKRQESVTAVDHTLDQLTNPFGHMSLDQKKELALFLFYRQLKVKIIVHRIFYKTKIFNRGQSVWERLMLVVELAYVQRWPRR